jgi:hypothetical protein
LDDAGVPWTDDRPEFGKLLNIAGFRARPRAAALDRPLTLKKYPKK